MIAHFQRHWKWLTVTGITFIFLAFFFFTSSGTTHEILRWVTLVDMALFGGNIIHILDSEIMGNKKCVEGKTK